MERNHNVKVKTIRCDNAGENKDTETHLRNANKSVQFEYTSSDTPQHNEVVDSRFATLYGRVRAMQHYYGGDDKLKLGTWAECVNTASDLWNIQVQKKEHVSPYQQFFGALPSYARHLQVFGRASIVLRPGKKNIKAKLKSKGDKKYFVGYAKNHSHDVYRMFNPESGRVSITRDILWLDRLIGDDYGMPSNQIVSFSGENKISDTDDDDDGGSTDYDGGSAGNANDESNDDADEKSNDEADDDSNDDRDDDSNTIASDHHDSESDHNGETEPIQSFNEN